MIKRKVYSLVERALTENRIPIIIGMRRIGKTTILEQLKDEKKNATYISWDNFMFQILSDDEFYNYIDQLCSQGGLLLFDEVQIRSKWDLMIKNLFDKYVSKKICQIVVTGSSSMILEGKDLGVTRTEKLLVDTWDFDEYCLFTKKEKNFENFENFLGYGFPEFMDHKTDFERMLNITLKSILEDDLSKAYPGIKTIGLLRFTYQLAYLTNGEVNETSVAKKSGISIPTVRRYMTILEKALILKKVYKIHEDGSHPKKSIYKIFLNPHMQIWLLEKKFKNLDNKIKGHIIESYWLHWAKGINGFNKTFYYLKDSQTDKEIDFVSLKVNGSFKTLHEIKYQNKIDFNDINQMIQIPAENKVLWCKQTKNGNGIKYVSILDLNKN